MRPGRRVPQRATTATPGGLSARNRRRAALVGSCGAPLRTRLDGSAESTYLSPRGVFGTPGSCRSYSIETVPRLAVILLALACARGAQAQSPASDEGKGPPSIQDNSFLMEEAY